MTKLVGALVLLAGLGFFAWTSNRKPDASPKTKVAARVMEPEARVLLQAAGAAAARTKVFRYAADYTTRGTGFKSTGRVWVDRVHGRSGASLTKSTARAPEPNRFEIATDGEQVFVLSHPDKKFIHGQYPERAYLLRQSAELVMTEIGAEAPFEDALKGSARCEGKQDVNGVPCDVVYVEYDRPGEHARWYFGPDALPRKVERFFNMFRGVPKTQQIAKVLTLTELEVGVTLAESDFRLTAPDGYEDIELKPREPLLASGTQAPEWNLNTPEGKSVSLASLRGSVVVMDFWATWCGPCKVAMPHVQKLHESFRDRPVKILGVNCMEIDGDPAAYMKDHDFTYGLLVEGDGVAEAYHVSGIPTFYILDQAGRVAFTASGFEPGMEAHLSEIIERLLTEGPATAEAGS